MPKPLEEEKTNWCTPHDWYPVQIGQLFNRRYEVLCKLGYGGTSTIWLAKDLERLDYVVLKVFTSGSSSGEAEIATYDHLRKAMQRSGESKVKHIRMIHGHFSVVSPYDGRSFHRVLIYQPTQMSLSELRRTRYPDGFPEKTIKKCLVHMLSAIQFLHMEANIIHGDLHGGNLMIGLTDNRQLSVFEQQERRQPSYRQRNKDTGAYTYASRPCGKPMAGPIVLADLGCSLIGRGPHTRCGMSLSLHSPEILLDRGFSFEHDIWTVGLTAWYLATKGDYLIDPPPDPTVEQQLALVVSVLGLPPISLLERWQLLGSKYFDKNGYWVGREPIPKHRLLEEQVAGGKVSRHVRDPIAFLQFIRMCLAWDPRRRGTAMDLMDTAWLRAFRKVTK